MFLLVLTVVELSDIQKSGVNVHRFFVRGEQLMKTLCWKNAQSETNEEVHCLDRSTFLHLQVLLFSF